MSFWAQLIQPSRVPESSFSEPYRERSPSPVVSESGGRSNLIRRAVARQ